MKLLLEKIKAQKIGAEAKQEKRESYLRCRMNLQSQAIQPFLPFNKLFAPIPSVNQQGTKTQKKWVILMKMKELK